MGSVRIIGGVNRSRILKFSDSQSLLRPTPDRVRETLFNWLGQDLTGMVCLDLFAGSGALGFEAVSRNAKKVIMVEKEVAIIKDLKRNQELLSVTNVDIIPFNAITFLERTTEKFDVIFLDPPYQSELMNKCLSVLSQKELLKPNGVIYIEYQIALDLSKYAIIKESKAGKVQYKLLTLNNVD